MNAPLIFEPSQSVVAQITQLSTLTMDEIKALWWELHDKAPPTHIRSFLEKRLAYRLQEREFKQTHQELAAKNAQRIQGLIQQQNQQSHNKRTPQPMPGTVLSRSYRDKTYQVTVTYDSQFEFEGRLYSSLSVIAREITGTRWSGPLFFGLRKANNRKGTKNKTQIKTQITSKKKLSKKDQQKNSVKDKS
ncbi:hypothetical protein AB833_04040 [Chromatiales bacterium (ex Bugula neritina AB1)]|nr:hypothetical protein AB833_04040 [Chromatiales bacterium (ex Bugula neritina AB1)]